MSERNDSVDENEFSPVGYEIRLTEKQERSSQKQWITVEGLVDDYGQQHEDIELELPTGFFWGTPWRMPHAGESGDDLGWQYGTSWSTTSWTKSETEATSVRKRLYVRKLAFNDDVKLTESVFQRMKALGVVHAKFVPNHAQDDYAHNHSTQTQPNNRQRNNALNNQSHNNNTHNNNTHNNNTHNNNTHSNRDPATDRQHSQTTGTRSAGEPKSRKGTKSIVEQPHSLPTHGGAHPPGVRKCPEQGPNGHNDSDTTPTASDSDRDTDDDDDTTTFHDKASHKHNSSRPMGSHSPDGSGTKTSYTTYMGTTDTVNDADGSLKSTASEKADKNTEGELRIVETSDGTVAEYDEAIYENQRSGLVGGFSVNWLIPYVDKRGEWSNAEGEPVPSSDDFKIPMGWKWKADWVVDDWQYAFSFWDKVWASDASNGSFVRRRKWSRTRHMLLNDKKTSVDTAQPPPINVLQINGYVTSCMVLVCLLMALTSVVQLWVFVGMGNTVTLLMPQTFSDSL
ncbi:hypothetical protein SARC_01710 [Sphaeroforma arctica JP610]|uniref:Peroxin/Ferlin domain-containing protein n=1 Tax=Sphaeroforma arctica JP610 TaxID=667725 RepID=A0A0L0GB77_9EUKA|nr:hypothetical protein SARC_01710 [Sphaeroforma arctica JP610]KNC86141.1 hypothetical protein SARC_01710 [Sphaeroforma arctica JP610]|eukprot:XP_014160043.1 hypothetical protein SARC_01710 [Sphaeroforma arctica JP610]